VAPGIGSLHCALAIMRTRMTAPPSLTITFLCHVHFPGTFRFATVVRIGCVKHTCMRVAFEHPELNV